MRICSSVLHGLDLALSLGSFEAPSESCSDIVHDRPRLQRRSSRGMALALRSEPRTQTGARRRILVVRSRRWSSVLVLIVLFIFNSGIACSVAEDSDPAASQVNSAPAPSASTSDVSWDNGLHIRSPNGQAQVDIGGMLQLDDRLILDPGVPQKLPDFILRRGQFVFLGKAFRRLDFRITAESRKDGPMTVRDAYIDVKVAEEMWVEIGKFKSPIGLERLQSPRYLMFAERALPTNLVPDRDVGVQVHGDIVGNKVTYMGGLFRGVPDGGNSEHSTNHGADGEFRVFAYPFRGTRASLLGGLGLGIGGSAGKERGALPSFTTAGLAQFFCYRPGAIADGERTRISPQADYYWRRIGVMAEYGMSAQDVRLGNATRRVANTAWQASTSFVLTGENASYSGVTPARAFNPAKHDWGAFEVAGRLNSLQVDPSAYPVLADPRSAAQKANGFQAGLNWYPQKYFKVVFNYAQTRFVGGAMSGNRPTENAFIVRFQFGYY